MASFHVEVVLLHRCSERLRWALPKGWMPKRPARAEPDWVYDNGSYWSKDEEECGMAMPYDPMDESGASITVRVNELIWIRCGNLAFVNRVEVESFTEDSKNDGQNHPARRV